MSKNDASRIRAEWGRLTKQMNGHAIAPYHAAYGFSLLANGSFERSNPWPTKPLWNRMYVTLIPNQVIKPAMLVMFTNHWKTRFEPVVTPMNDRNENAIPHPIAASGSPRFVVNAKNRGAFPASASPYSAREDVYRSDDAADHAEVSSAALITEGRPLIPARRIAMTNGEPSAVPLCARSGSLEGTRSPMMNVPVM